MDKNYTEHKVFNLLSTLSRFYESLSFSIIGFVTIGTTSVINIDTYLLSSIKGSIDSINIVLKSGRINDSYSLLRKYYDSVVINIYSHLYLEDNFSIDNLAVKQIHDWVKGKSKLPAYKEMIIYITKSKRLESILPLLLKSAKYEDIRQRCNDHTHYNFYHYALYNDNQIHTPERVSLLDEFENDCLNVFLLHFFLLFYIKDYYMVSSDYVDYLDIGSNPPENSQYWVAPFVQEIFDSLVKTNKPEVAEEFLKHTRMELV